MPVNETCLYSAFLIYGSFCFSMFFFVWFLIPETKGLSLEKMDDLFGVTELAKHVEEEAGVGTPTREIEEKTNVVRQEEVPANRN